MVDFGNKLKQLRLHAGMTQKDLAELIGVTKSVISYYELTERYPSPDILVKIASIFNVSTDFLLGLKHNKTLDVTDLSDEDISLLQHTILVLRNKNTYFNETKN